MKTSRIRVLPVLAALVFGVSSVAGCGHTDEEMAGKQREIDRLAAELRASEKSRNEKADSFKKSQDELEQLRAKLKDAGIAYEGLSGKLQSTEADKKKLQVALTEYETRVKQLDEMKRRFSELKARLDKLTSVGLKVTVRNNRMVIQLPGDVLFDSGLDLLKPDGKRILKQVAEVINNDSTLKTRNFQVAGHTDSDEYGGPFRDNWGLSLMRARQVVIFLTAPVTPKGPVIPTPPGKEPIPFGGGLDQKNWSAAGYGMTDPAAGTVEKQSREEKAKNRRVELVLQPNVEEMLVLKDL